jgi:ribosomal protein S18 acetylase RimI-like enzyme
MDQTMTSIHGGKVRVRLAQDDDQEETDGMDQRFIDNGAPTGDTIFHVAELVFPCPLGSGLTVKEIVGYAGHRLPPELPGMAFLSRSGVLPEARGIGIQKRLIRARLAHIRRHSPGVTHAVTYTAVSNAASSNSLIACGFKLFWPRAGELWVGPEFNYWRKAIR